MAWIYQIAEICQRRGGVGVRGVSRMDAAAKPHGRVYGVPALRYRPANLRNASFCFCCCLGLKPLQVQGAALPTNPQCSRAATASRNPAWACPDSGA